MTAPVPPAVTWPDRLHDFVRDSKPIGKIALTVATTTAIAYFKDATQTQIFVHKFFPHATVGQALVAVFLLTNAASSLSASILPARK